MILYLIRFASRSVRPAAAPNPSATGRCIREVFNALATGLERHDLTVEWKVFDLFWTLLLACNAVREGSPSHIVNQNMFYG